MLPVGPLCGVWRVPGAILDRDCPEGAELVVRAAGPPVATPSGFAAAGALAVLRTLAVLALSEALLGLPLPPPSAPLDLPGAVPR